MKNQSLLPENRAFLHALKEKFKKYLTRLLFNDMMRVDVDWKTIRLASYDIESFSVELFNLH